MEKSFRIISTVTLFFIFFCLMTDIVQLQAYKERMKDSINMATKAASLQIDSDPEKIKYGVFYIDEDKSLEVYEEVMKKNLGIKKDDKDKVIGELDIVGAVYPKYTIDSLTGKVVYEEMSYLDEDLGVTYKITNPTFVASKRFVFKGLLLEKEVLVKSNYGGSQLLGN